MLRTPDHLRRRPLLDHHAALHHRHALGVAPHQVEVVGDEEQRHAGLGPQLLQQIEDLQADRGVERCGRLVGDEELRIAGERHGDHRPLALPAGELMRIAARAPLGVVDPHAAHCPDGLGPGLRPAQFAVQLDRLDDLVADRIDRVQRGHRLLEDHGDVAPPQVVQICSRHGEDITTLEQDLAAQARALDQAQRRERSHRLAGSRLADQRQLLPGVEREAHPVDHPTGAEVDAEIAHFEQAHSASPSSTLRGSSASRNASPMRISSSSITTSTANVDREIHHA